MSASPVDVVEAARGDPDKVVLAGFHAVKHALRFGAAVEMLLAPELDPVLELARELAPDLVERLSREVRTVGSESFQRLTPRPPATGIVGLATRPAIAAADVLAASGPVVLLERPVHLGNLGAAIRVAAAAGAGGVLSVGAHDPWAPEAVRGAAGLQFALPVARADRPPTSARPLLALDPEGEPIGEAAIPGDALLAFGTERHGLGAGLRDRADSRIAIPMEPGVSSLNLATAVAVVLYSWRLGEDDATTATRSRPG